MKKTDTLLNVWQKSPLIWHEGSTEYISVVFTWDLPKVQARIRQRTFGVGRYVAGGPAVKMLPQYFDGDPVEIQDDYPGVLQKHNPLATWTSQGCPNKCGFCAVDKIHPEFREIENFPVAPMVCDDNLLACSEKHFDEVIDKLKAANFTWFDFNQGLDVRLLTKYHARRFAELKNPIIRLAWDNTTGEDYICGAIVNLIKAGVRRRNIRCYVLIGYEDSPGYAEYRLVMLRYAYGIMPNPMRYQPPGCLKKNEYVAPNWSHYELDRFMSYWSNIRFTGGVPFEEYVHHKKPINNRQLIFRGDLRDENNL